MYTEIHIFPNVKGTESTSGPLHYAQTIHYMNTIGHVIYFIYVISGSSSYSDLILAANVVLANLLL